MIVNNNAKLMEVFCAYAIKEVLFCNETFVAGDLPQEHIPDIYNIEKTLGIEVVQLEQACDLDTKYVWAEYEKCDGNYGKIKEFCDEKFPGRYELMEYAGKLASFSPFVGAHSVDWMSEINIRNLNNKLKKLNRQNYSGISGQLFLCASITQRARTIYDALLVLYNLWQASAQYTARFDKLIVVTSSHVYLFDLNKIREISPIKNGKIIYNIQVEGDNYSTIYEYDYNKVIRMTKAHFDAQLV